MDISCLWFINTCAVFLVSVIYPRRSCGCQRQEGGWGGWQSGGEE